MGVHRTGNSFTLFSQSAFSGSTQTFMHDLDFAVGSGQLTVTSSHLICVNYYQLNRLSTLFNY
jgi:hypothetical protein